jgi:hypothetical protein
MIEVELDPATWLRRGRWNPLLLSLFENFRRNQEIKTSIGDIHFNLIASLY